MLRDPSAIPQPTPEAESRPFGLAVERSIYSPLLDWIEAPQRSGAGNVILVVNREQPHEIGSLKVAHVVLTPEEALRLTAAIHSLVRP